MAGRRLHRPHRAPVRRAVAHRVGGVRVRTVHARLQLERAGVACRSLRAGDAALVGRVRIPEMRDVVAAITAASTPVGLVAGVCTGAFLLHAAGVLGGAAATTHWEDVQALGGARDGGSVRDDVRWVDAGHVVTSGGMTSGIAMTLHLVERLVDGALAQATATQIDYVWTEHRAAD